MARGGNAHDRAKTRAREGERNADRKAEPQTASQRESVSARSEAPPHGRIHLQKDISWVWERATSWPVVGFAVAALWAFGGMAVSDHLYAFAYLIFFSGDFLLWAKWIFWVRSERPKGRTLPIIYGSAGICLAIVVEVAIMSYFENMRMSIEGTQIAAAVDKETERANVRALGVRFVSAEPSINMLNSFN